MGDESSVRGLTADIAQLNRDDLTEDIEIFESVARTNRGAAQRHRVRNVARTLPPPEQFRDDHQDQQEQQSCYNNDDEASQLVQSMTSQFNMRMNEGGTTTTAAPSHDYPEPPKHNYAQLFQEACARRNVSGRNVVGREMADPKAAEKRELRRKIGVLRDLGFDVPTPNECAFLTVEDMQHILKTNSLDASVVLMVNRIVKFILSVVSFVVFFNAVKGPFLPLSDTYMEDVREECSQPLFKYAIYQIVMRHGFSGNLGPWFIILIALFAPIVEAFVFKLADFVGSSDTTSVFSREALRSKLHDLKSSFKAMFTTNANATLESANKVFGDKKETTTQQPQEEDVEDVDEDDADDPFGNIEEDEEDLIVAAD